MPALASPATWRTEPYSYRRYLYILAPAIVFKARVNMATATYPLAEITYDTVTAGAFGDIQVGMTVLIGSTEGAWDLGIQRIRLAADADSIFIGWASRGARLGEVNLADNAYITVLNDFRVWSKIPRFTDSGTMFKDYDLVLGTFGTQQPPVANLGCGYAEFVNTVTSLITVSFDGTGSFAVASGASIASYLWDVDDGTITVGTDTSSAITATFPKGFRWVSLTVTDSNSKTHTARVPVFAANTTDTLPILDFDVLEDTLEQSGKRMNFVVNAAIPDATYPPGTLVMYWEREVYGTTAGSLAGPTGREHMKFIGWHTTASAAPAATEQGIISGTEFACVGVAGRLGELPGFPQTVKRKSSPSKWSQMANMDIDRYLHYILHWHSTALELADYSQSGLGSSYPLKTLQSDGQSLYDQTNQRANAIAHLLTCDQRGRLFVEPDPNLLDASGGSTTAPRTTTSIVTLTDADWIDQLGVEENYFPRQHWLTGAAIVADPSELAAVQCISPGNAPGQGAAADLSNYRLVVNQDELNAQTGHLYARNNTRWPSLLMQLANTGDAGIEPAFMEWVTATFDDALFERDWEFTSVRLLPIRVSISHSNDESFVKDVEIEFQVETTGTPAQTVTVNEGGAGLPVIDLPGIILPVITLPPIAAVDPTTFLLVDGLIDMAGFNDDNYIYRTNNFDNASPTWTRTLGTWAGDIIMWTCDPFSPGYTGTGTSINGWILTTTGIYRLENIFSASMTTTLQRSHTTGITFGNIFASWGRQNWVVAYLYYGTSSPFGSWCSYTLNGSTWTEAVITTHRDTSSASTMLYPSSRLVGTVWAGAYTATGANPAAKGYKSTNYGATWAVDTSIDPGFQATNLHITWDDNASQQIAYYTHRNSAGTLNSLKRRNADGSTTDVTPTTGGASYAGRTNQWGTYASPQNRQIVVSVGQRASDSAGTVFTSTDAGANWTLRSGPTAVGSRYIRGAIGGDDSTVVYLWGEVGRVAYSDDSGATIQDKRGNISSMSSPTPGTMLAIAGGVP